MKKLFAFLFARGKKCINCGSYNTIGGNVHPYRCLDCGAVFGPY